MQPCPNCGARIVNATRELRQRFGGRDYVLRVPSGDCRQCGTGFLDAGLIERGELEIACHLAASGSPDGAALRFMRKALGWRAVALAQALGVAPETLSRWETGQRRVDRCAWVVVGSLVLERAERSVGTEGRLRALASAGAKPPRGPVVVDARRVPPPRTGARSKQISGVIEKPAGRSR